MTLDTGINWDQRVDQQGVLYHLTVSLSSILFLFLARHSFFVLFCTFIHTRKKNLEMFAFFFKTNDIQDQIRRIGALSRT